MDSFFESLGEILANLPQHPLAVISLIALAVGLLAYLLFRDLTPPYRVFAFVVVVLGAAGIVYEVSSFQDGNDPDDSPTTEASAEEDQVQTENAETDSAGLAEQPVQENSPCETFFTCIGELRVSDVSSRED